VNDQQGEDHAGKASGADALYGVVFPQAGRYPRSSMAMPREARARRCVPRVRALAAPALLALALAPRPVGAQDEPSARDTVLAEALFEDGRKLMAEGRFAEACPKLAESQRLDPGGGTLLNLAICHAEAGKTATAWAEIKKAISVAARDRNARREAFARKKLAQIEAMLSYVVVTVAPDARTPGLAVLLDGAPLGSAALGTRFPVDPGSHEVVATAPNRRPFRVTLLVEGHGDPPPVVIPVLAPEHSAVAPERAGGSAGERSSPSGSGPGGWRVASFVVGGLGLAAAGVGIGFGVQALQREKDAERLGCVKSACPDAKALDASDEAHRWSMVTNITVGVGLATTAAGVALFLLAPAGASRKSATRFAPMVGASGGGAVWLGSF
jgi:hypothetical protein